MFYLKFPHWLTKSKNNESVQLSPREFYVTDSTHVCELCELWGETPQCHRECGEYSYKFWEKAKECANLPPTMLFHQPEFCGHFIKFVENKKG